ncbi:MAG: 50S ribosomal protein L3 [SAR202 cluster bacterium]|nr:50S ribosomal protein L3 [SAR202 cluster bacterium]
MGIGGLLGKKVGMTHLFIGEQMVPVTVLEVGPCVVTQVRNGATDGYEAVQIGFGAAKSLTKPALGHLKAAGSERVKHLKEFPATQVSELRVGQKLLVSEFAEGQYVDVTGVSKGRGFQGGVKRYNFRGGPKTHGQSDRHRAPGSIGSTTFMGRVIKGKRMAGHTGMDQTTSRNLRVVKVDAERNLLFVGGGVAGANGGLVSVRHAKRAPKASAAAKE